MVVVKVKIDETWLAALDRLAADRRQSRAIAGGLMLEDSIIDAVEGRPVEAEQRATGG
jgi:hypothetical protein